MCLRDVDQVHDMMDDIAEQQDVAKEISEAISNPVAFENDIDDVSNNIFYELLGVCVKFCNYIEPCTTTVVRVSFFIIILKILFVLVVLFVFVEVLLHGLSYTHTHLFRMILLTTLFLA